MEDLGFPIMRHQPHSRGKGGKGTPTPDTAAFRKISLYNERTGTLVGGGSAGDTIHPSVFCIIIKE